MFFVVDSGSVIEQKCTKETDTICRCVADFVPVESDSATCECSRGFGLKQGDTDRSQKGKCYLLYYKCQRAFLFCSYLFFSRQYVPNVRTDISAVVQTPPVKNGKSKFASVFTKMHFIKL